MHGSTERGFTMVELMFVVAVVGILAAVAVTAYSRNVRKARSGEVIVMFAEIKAKEDAYYAENGSYLGLCPSPTAGVCDEDDYFPATLPGAGRLVDITGGVPATWTAARIQPGKGALYCQYVVVAGPAGTDPAGAIGIELWGAGNTPAVNWFYMVAQCDWDGSTVINAKWWQRGDLSTLGRENEQR